MSVEDTLEAINKQLENHENRLKELEVSKTTFFDPPLTTYFDPPG